MGPEILLVTGRLWAGPSVPGTEKTPYLLVRDKKSPLPRIPGKRAKTPGSIDL
jgi:hypothetical protein